MRHIAPGATRPFHHGLLALAIVAIGCAGKAPPVATPASATSGEPAASDPRPAADSPAPPAVAALRQELDLIFDAPTLQTAVVSALIQSLDSGQVLYRHNPDTLVVPASNMKIVTMAVAASRLGWGHRFETRLEALTPVSDGVLDGDLIVTGGGDPTINSRNGDRFSVFREWAARLKSAGIRRISGRIVGDDDAFEDERYGAGWSWDDFAYGYAAPVGALQFNENVVEIVIRPGATVGAPATIELRPAGGDVQITAAYVTTTAAGSPSDISFTRFPGRSEMTVAGDVAMDAREHVERGAVNNPTLYFVRALRDVLQAEGIAVDGDGVDIDDVPDAATLKSSPGQRLVLSRHQSAPLADIGKTLMKVSQNLYAETLFRAISGSPGPASVKVSRERAADTLRAWGVAANDYAIADGSGLSRLNLVSATLLVRILRAMTRDAEGFAAFEATLPVGGRDGTLAGRMKATRAEGNAMAKTGTLTGVRSLSGYVRTLDGERLVFSMLVNNFLSPASAIDALVDQAVERLANFQR